MLMTILSVGMGGSLLAKEESERTLEQLLARPLTRTQLLLAKVLAMTAVLGIVSVASIVCVIALASLTDMDISGGVLVIATLLSAAFSLTIGMIAFTLTAMGRYARSASLAIASFIGLGGYIISSLSVQVAWLKWPSKLFPFHYYNPEVVLRGGMQLGGVVFPAICVSACIAISIVTFRRRDLSN
jgi:ABC-2 type transport system permease protein